jgi:DNA (cytosine-5)-methyltransferase 1
MNYHFPNSFQHEDIRTTDFRIWRGRIDLLTGGFPCQPYSHSGKRLGTEDDRHLWPEMLRAIREIQPSWIVGENVRGFVNWNKGLVFDQAQIDLEAEGYEVIPFLLPACGVNAPHERYRIWPVAYASRFVHAERLDNRRNKTAAIGSESEDQQQAGWQEDGQRVWTEFDSSGETTPDTRGGGQSRSRRSIECIDSTAHTNWKASWANHDGGWPIQSPICAGNDGLPGQLVDITFLDWSEAAMSALGNAIVPQVAHQIFKAIEAYEGRE